MNKSLLDKFGQILITEVRDQSIEMYEMTVAGKIKSADAIEFHTKLKTFDDEQLKTMRKIVVDSIDETIHNLLWMIEQHENIDVMCGQDDTAKENIRELSDGLSGEIYTEDGWIVRYSKHKENYD